MNKVDANIVTLLEQLAQNQEEFSRSLAGLEGRMEQMHDVLRRSAETVMRLKLMADNARKLAEAQNEAIAAIAARLGGGPS